MSTNFHRQNMLKFSVTFLFCLFYTIHPQEDFTTFDYCNITEPRCVKGAHPDVGGHPACDCTPLPGRADVQARNLKAIIAFRKKMLHIHNYYRNRLASGEEDLPEAADMMVLNWDSELEHLARCRLLNSFATKPTVLYLYAPCSYNSKREFYGQNAYWSRNLDDLNSIWYSVRIHWYSQIVLITEALIDSFNRSGGIYEYSHMMSSTTTHIGCVRAWNFEEALQGIKLVVICNYKREIDDGLPIYKRGKACSACPDGTKCETLQYPALCGKLQRVPRINVTVMGDVLEEEEDGKNATGSRKNSAFRNMEGWLLSAASISFVFKIKLL